MLSWIGFILFGLAVGLIARAIMPGRDQMSLPLTALLGAGGALLAGWLGRALGWYEPGEGAGFITSTIGALVVLFGYNAFVRRRGAKRNKKDREYPKRVA